MTNLIPRPWASQPQGAHLQGDSSSICRGSGLEGLSQEHRHFVTERTVRRTVPRGPRPTWTKLPRERSAGGCGDTSSVLNASARPARPVLSQTFPAGDSHPPRSVATRKTDADPTRRPRRPSMALCSSSVSEGEFLCAQVSGLVVFFESLETVHFLT